MIQAPALKAIEEDAVAFCRLLQEEAGIPGDSIGITGSLLIGLQTELSDLDISIFGMQNCEIAYRALLRILDNGSNAELRRLNVPEIDSLYAQRVVDTPMDFQEFVRVEKRKVNQGSFRQRTYFVRFIKDAEEVEPYGCRSYTPLGRAAITALVADDRDAIFTPCKYRLSDVQNPAEISAPNPCEILSFRGRFCEQAHVGERIKAFGTLERVRNKGGEVWHRLLLGNSPEDTMVLWRR